MNFINVSPKNDEENVTKVKDECGELYTQQECTCEYM